MFEKLIKTVVLGNYEKVLHDIDPSLEALEEPWLILMTLGFGEVGVRSEKERKVRFREAVVGYFKQMKNQVMSG